MMKTDLQGVQPKSVSSLSDSNSDGTESAATLSKRSCAKRKNEREDDVDESLCQSSVEAADGEPKRLRVETSKFTDEKRQRVVEIIEQEFNNELQTREEEAMLIEERIQRAQRTLQYLCYAVVSDFYSRDKTITQQVTSTRQRRIHPAVKELLAGKHPKDSSQASSSTESPNQSPSLLNNCPSQGKASKTPPKTKRNPTPNPESSVANTVTKVPRYIPPKPKDSPGKTGGSSRGVHNKVKQRILIGNVSKWLPTESREDTATHKWMVYVRGPKDAPDISGFVDKVRFFLHPSYRPNDVVEVVQAPFHLSRRGWGEFPVRVQIHFQDPLNKPVDVIHHLKLDRTCTGLQTLGAETVVDVWINKNNYNRQFDHSDRRNLSPVGQEIFIQDDEDDDNFLGESPPSSPTKTPATNVKTEATSPPAASAEEDISSVVSSFLQKPSVSESVNTPKDSVSTSIKTDCFLSQPPSVSSPGIVVSSPLKGLRPSTPSNTLFSSPSKVSLKPASSVVVSSPSLRLTTPVVLPGTVETATPVASPGVPSQSVGQLKRTSGIVIPTTEAQLRPAASVTSSRILVSSPSKVLLKPSIPGVVVSSTTAQPTQVAPGTQASNPSKVLILNRPTLASKPTTSSTINSDVVLSPSTSVIPANLTKLVPNRLTEALQRKTSSVAGNTVKLAQSTDPSAKLLIPSKSNQILTAGGQIIKVVSPSKVVQNFHPPVSRLSNSVTNVLTTATNTVKAVQVPVPPKTKQNALGVPTPSTPGKPISLVKYRAPDGSIRFLQVSQLNTARPAVSNQPPTPVTQNALRQVLVRSANSGMNIPRNPSPVIRLPTPSNVTPTQNQGQVLMVRDGKVYLVRPSPIASTNQTRQPAPQTLIPQTPRQPEPQVIASQSTVPGVPVQRPPGTPLVAPTTIVTSMPALSLSVNTVRAVPSTKLLSEKAVVSPRPRGPQLTRPGVSLLKSNVLQQSSASSPSVSLVTSPCPSPMPSPKTVSHRIILPKPTVSPVSSSTYRSKLYKQMLSTAVRSCPTKSCPGGVVWAIRWMVRSLPLISAEARCPEYQVLHPYCAPDANTFLSWNLGKQRACELMRAQTVWRLLQDVGWDESEIWTVREILIWARFHGYTPGLPFTDLDSGLESSVIEEVCNYKRIDEEDAEWLNKQENSKLTKSVDIESSDEEVDVISVNLSPSKVCIKQEPAERTNNCLLDPVEDMPLDKSLLGAGAFVSQALNNIGIQLEPEQLVTGVKYPAAQRILVQAVQSLVDDLVRRSLAKAWGPNIARSPRSIELSHVCSAILSRPEFDFLSCTGLGVFALPGGPSTSKMHSLNPS